MKALVVYSYYDYSGKQCFGNMVYTFRSNYPTEHEIKDIRQDISINKFHHGIKILNIIRLEETDVNM